MKATRITIHYPDGTTQEMVPAAVSPPPPGPAWGPLTNQSRLRVNLDQPDSSSTYHLFADAMRTARPIGMHVGPLEQVVFVEQPAAGDNARAYHLVTSNPVSVTAFNSGGTTVTSDDQQLHYIKVPEGQPNLFLRYSADPGKAALYRPGYDGSQTFTREALAQLAPFGGVRFMDFEGTNASPRKTWADRLTHYQPPELAIELCNQTGKDIWLCVPHAADDDYVTQLGKLIAATLRPYVACYVEYSNELWNTAPPFNVQRNHALAEARKAIAAGDKTIIEADGRINETFSLHRWCAKRTVEIKRLLPERCKVVLANQNGYGKKASEYGYWFKIQLNYIREHLGEPKQFLHALASAPYGGIGDPNPRPEHRKAIAAMAKANGLRYLAYEGGFHNTDGGQAMLDKHSAPEAGPATEAYLMNMLADCDEFYWFVLSSNWKVKADGTVSVWGLAPGSHTSSHKLEAAKRFAETVKV